MNNYGIACGDVMSIRTPAAHMGILCGKAAHLNSYLLFILSSLFF
jgi:hypothetical protein